MENFEKVYIVSTGIYSEYQIRAVFNSKDKADDYIQQHGTDYRIEEWNINEEDTSKQSKLWSIDIFVDNKEIRKCEIATDIEEKYFKDSVVFYDLCSNGDFLSFLLQANSMNEAIKIAYERLNVILEGRDTFYKKVFVKSTYSLLLSNKHINYFTGEIMSIK